MTRHVIFSSVVSYQKISYQLGNLTPIIPKRTVWFSREYWSYFQEINFSYSRLGQVLMICKSYNSRCSSPAFQFLTLNMYFLILKKFGDNLERNLSILKNSFLEIDFEIKTSDKKSNVSTSLKSFSSKSSFRN